MLNKCVLGTLQLHEHIFHACLLYIYMSTEVTLYVSVVFACLGFLSPANRGSLVTCVFYSLSAAYCYTCGMVRLSRVCVCVVFACLGFLSPANRGSLMTCVLVLYVCLGTPAGYVSARIYKSKLLCSSCRCF